MSELPPWTGDDVAMLRWLERELDDLIKKDGAKARARRALPLSSQEKQALFPEDSDEGAMAAAERGDIRPLQRRYPELARYLKLPGRQRGQRYPKDTKRPHDKRLTLAILEVSRIREIWQKHFARKNRSRHRRGEQSAEWFAAARWACSEDEILEAMKIRRLRLPK